MSTTKGQKSKENEHDQNNNDNKSRESEHGQTTRTMKHTRKNKKTLWTTVKHNLNRSKGRDKAAREIETFIFQYLSIT